jgi:spermidine/putrescine transport system substrate-binding protein
MRRSPCGQALRVAEVVPVSTTDDDPEHRTRPIPRTTSRRDFLLRSMLLAAGAPSLGALLEACSNSASNSDSSSVLQIATPTHPVKWPIYSDNKPIADGLSPEKNATLQLYNYEEYIGPQVVKQFEKEYNCNVRVTTFNDTDEAITKIRAGHVPFDIYFPSYDQISRMVTAKLIRPLNHSYIPNIKNVWPTFSNPWYDQEWRYTIPYSVYTTGIGWRSDRVTADVAGLPNPYDTLWDPQYKGETAVIDDWHTMMSMVLLRNGKTDINTDNPADIALMQRQMDDLLKKTSPRVTINMYTDLPGGQLGICQMWSGDLVNAQYYLKGSTPVSVLRYWFPQDGKGEVDNDLNVILSGGHNPVLAHHFLNFMLRPDIAKKNFGYIGYQPPQRDLDTKSLVKQGFITKYMPDTAVQQSWFDVGYRLLELSPANDAAWHRVWQEFKAGG